MKIAFKILLFLGIIALLAFLLWTAAYIQTRMFIYNPPAQREPSFNTPADFGLEFTNITLTTTDNVKLAAWYIPSHNRAAIIIQHGFKSNRAAMLAPAKLFTAKGYGVMLADLRAHGESGGEMITFGHKEVMDMDAVYRYLLTRPEIDPGKIGIYGVSLGGVVSLIYAAANEQIKAVAVDSAFTSLEDEIPMALSKTGLPVFFFTGFVKKEAEKSMGIPLASVSALSVVDKIAPRPLFIMQGGKDTTVPPDSGRRLFAKAGEPKFLWFEPESGHVAFSVQNSAMSDEFVKRVVDGFFTVYLAPLAEK